MARTKDHELATLRSKMEDSVAKASPKGDHFLKSDGGVL